MRLPCFRPLTTAVRIGLLFTLSASAYAETTATPDAGVTELAGVKVIGTQEKREQVTGSAQILGKEELESSRALTVNDALRKVPGLNLRDEEGFGLRPNIGVRGLNPSRSTKVMLLEDGLPAAYAPYGDNASYYHAPIQRYERIEVLKGMEMLRFGPQNVGAVINYLTPDTRNSTEGVVQLMAGSRGFANAQAHYTDGGFRVDFSHKQGDGARDNTVLEQSDLFAKYQVALGESQALTLRANALRETSQVSYTGITDAELSNFGREYNPFRNDAFDITRHAASLTHEWRIADATRLTTSAYFARFERDWWRQSSSTSDTQCGNAFRDARASGLVVDPDGCASTQGRLRSYDTYGIEPRLSHRADWFGADSELQAGLRWHREVQERRQLNGTSPTARSGVLAEDNRRETEALSAFVFQSLRWNRVGLNLALRHERIDYARLNRLNDQQGQSQENQTMAGLGLSFTTNDALQWFADVHQGFAPARAEDVINNNGGSVEVEAERSINAELGLRGKAGAFDYEFALFRNDFRNQVLVGSIAGGSTPLAEGEALYQGLELNLGVNRQALSRREGEFYAIAALTSIPVARQDTAFISTVSGAVVPGSIAGNRLPYAPKGMASVRVGYALDAIDLNLELQSTARQFSDFANSEQVIGNGNGQFGAIGGYTVFHATLNYAPLQSDWSGFLTVKNLSDKLYIVDRTRGILLGNPRQVVVGVEFRW